jgi:hypothetical protein
MVASVLAKRMKEVTLVGYLRTYQKREGDRNTDISKPKGKIIHREALGSHAPSE